MPQIQLPIFPEGVTHITPLLAFRKEDERVTYFNGSMPVFVHDEADVASFRMITAQFCVNGNARQADISRAFGVTKISLKRAVKRYREQGPKGFYTPRNHRGPAVLTPAVLAEAQQMLDDVDFEHTPTAPEILVASGYGMAEGYYYHMGHSWARFEHGGRLPLELAVVFQRHDTQV